jgi:hypothetical protein
MDVNTRRLIPMCFLSEKYLELCKNEFRKLVDLGAAGMLYDECLHHTPALCCFDTTHGHRYGEAAYRGDEPLIVAFREILAGKEFMMAGEAVYEFQYDYYDLSYTRTANRHHQALSRYLRPHSAIMTAVVGFRDRNIINQCLLNRYIISYEPFNFKGKPSDFPATIAYGAKMDRLRSDWRTYFWDGEFCGALGGAVTTAAGADYPDYAVYRGTTGKNGMVICNYENQAITVIPKLTSGLLTQYRLIDEDSPRELDHSGAVTLPPNSAAAVI